MCECVSRERQGEIEGEWAKEEEGAGGSGGGLRTKETNLNEMTCFRGVKSGELGFRVPSPRLHIHLERPGLLVHRPQHVNGRDEQTARVTKIGGEKKDGDLV